MFLQILSTKVPESAGNKDSENFVDVVGGVEAILEGDDGREGRVALEPRFCLEPKVRERGCAWRYCDKGKIL